MKTRRKIAAGLLFMLLAIGLCPQTALAAEGDNAKEESRKLSLEAAYEILKESDTYKLISLQNESDQATIKSYTEQISSNNQTIRESKAEGTSSSNAKSSNKTLQEKREYANKLYNSNVDARENAVYQEFVQKYYNLKSTEKNVEITAESLELKEQALELANVKFECGTVSKLDVLQSEIACKQAVSSYQSAKNKLELEKMEFNSYLGLALTTELTLTSEIEETSLPSITLDAAIASALEKRVEFISAEHTLSEAEKSFQSVSAYPRTSATYLKGLISYTQAQLAYDAVEDEIRIDVTEKYREMTEKYDAVQLDKMNSESAEESLELAMSRYELGMGTLSDVQSAQLTLENTKASYASDLLAYRMAVENFTLCMGTGTSTVAL